MEAEDADRAARAVEARLDAPDEPVAEEEGQDVVPPAPLRGRDVHLPEVVEAEERAQQVAIPRQRVQRREERHTGGFAAREVPLGNLALGLREERQLVGDDMPHAPHALDGDREQLAAVHELGQQLPRGAAAAIRRPVARRRRSQEDLGLARRPQEPVGAVPAQQPVEELLALWHPLGEESGREQPLREVVVAAVALAAGDAEDAGLGERLQHGP